ncbi:hypothetical protein [Maridesulfovibrio ferrireducens]|uniref:hypothetical protein n=1 Tax=Maridesulfovibrio ferrireducens TaxID=246191 RepID=UPI001A2E535C|nr:hypothetical protein [Maridesulfovibrio ferrireducens]MBI9112380.1 hypothetical protein [Maridesulfovibrio ferrireducens]
MSQEAHKHLASISDKIIKCYFRMTFNFNFLNDGIGHVKVEGEKFNSKHGKYSSEIAIGENGSGNESYSNYTQVMLDTFNGTERAPGLYNQTMKTFRDAFFFLALLQWKGEKKGVDLDINQNGKSYFPDMNLQYLQTEEFEKSFAELKTATDWIMFSYEDLLHAYVHNKNDILGSLERN